MADVDINQDTLLDFIDTFNKSLEPNPWISAVNLAGFAGEALPDPASLLFGFAVEAATKAIMEGQSLFCSNKFLNCVNVEFFIPRGLVCLVVTWQPGNYSGQFATNFEEEVDLPQARPDLRQEIANVAAGNEKPLEGWRELKTQMYDLMKPTRGDFSWPEPAPLIFPDFEGTPGKADVEAKKKNAWDRIEDWINDHSDKRAQASWIDDNKDYAGMNLMPQPRFKSRYADPNHQASSGDLVSLITAGRWRLAKNSKAESSKQPEKMADTNCHKEKEVQEGGKKYKTQNTTEERKKSLLGAGREKKDHGETGEMANRQERNRETMSPNGHKQEGGSANDIWKDNATKTEDECRTGEIEDGRASAGAEKGRAKEVKKKGGSSSKSVNVFKGLFQKDVLYLAILNLPSQQETTDDTIGPP
ncbi:hypothetical protein BDP67DRAFT_583659 [Colletotrichum lupini]|nr:hypothetical protein BDP67DRAFT_583659 [Colletotrichum lupini]